MIHIDLFAGIGGNSLAFDTVFHEQKNTHIFCEIEPFCQAVLRKHWPDAYIHSNIRSFTYPTIGGGQGRPMADKRKQDQKSADSDRPFMLTGGFPCQPFSQAGRRKGTADDRYLWPAMLRAIRNTKPQWVIAENVRGLVTWNEGMVLETVCHDMEKLGYEVQPLIIPAVAVGAPHRRDRIWFVAHRSIERRQQKPGRPFSDEGSNEGRAAQNDHIPASEDKGRRYDADTGRTGLERGQHLREHRRQAKGGKAGAHGSARQLLQIPHSNAPYPEDDRSNRRPEAERRDEQDQRERQAIRHQSDREGDRPDWSTDWHEIAAQLCRMDDGLPTELDGAHFSAPAHRKARLKALGNAIVPQVAMEIMQAIKQTI